MTSLEYLIGALMLAVIFAPLFYDWYRRQPKAEPTPRDLHGWSDPDDLERRHRG